MVSASTPPDRPPLSPAQVASPVLAEAADDEAEMPLPSDPQTFFLGGIFALCVLAALYEASSVILPVVLAFVLNLLLKPAVQVLVRIHLPRALGALVAVLLTIAALVGLIAALSVPAAIWAKRLPEGVPRLEAHLVVLQKPIRALQMILQQAEEVADAPGQKASLIPVRHDLGLTSALFAGMRAVLDGLFTTVVVLYFLLVSGDTLSSARGRSPAKVSRQAASRGHLSADSRGHIRISGDGHGHECRGGSRYSHCNVPLRTRRPGVMGRHTFLLNYIPILGPLVGTCIFVLAGMLSFESLWWALLPPALYFGIHLIEGETLTPMLLARRFTLNPVLIILALVFWFWMWGVPGAILAVPMLAILKIVCDRLRPLKALVTS
jgi:predicted PurR-regulated permease PerM